MNMFTQHQHTVGERSPSPVSYLPVVFPGSNVVGHQCPHGAPAVDERAHRVGRGGRGEALLVPVGGGGFIGGDEPGAHPHALGSITGGGGWAIVGRGLRGGKMRGGGLGAWDIGHVDVKVAKYISERAGGGGGEADV